MCSQIWFLSHFFSWFSFIRTSDPRANNSDWLDSVSQWHFFYWLYFRDSLKVGRSCQGVKIIFDNFFIFARNKSKMLKNYQFLGVSACFVLTNLLQFEIHNSYDLRHVPWKARFWFLSPRSDASSIFCFSIDLQNSNWNQKKLLCFLSDVKRRTMPNSVFQGRFSKLIGFFGGDKYDHVQTQPVIKTSRNLRLSERRNR